MSSEPPLPATAEAVLTFLESVGRRSEAELYLRLFRAVPKQSFAIIAAEAPVVDQALGSLLEQLTFLSELGLVAPVVVGLFDPGSAQSAAEQLAERLPTCGLRAKLHALTEEGLAERLSEELGHEEIPIISFSPDPSQGPGERFHMLGRLARDLDTRKLVVLRRRGGLGPHGEQPLELGNGYTVSRHSGGISIINLRSHLDALLSARVLDKSEEELLQHTHQLLEITGRPQITVSVTSPLTLLRELFTVKGAGTLIKTGTEIERAAEYGAVDTERLRGLLETSFSRRLHSAFFSRPPLAIYLETNYRGVAILEPSPVAPYLTKFAVEPLAQGEGMGQDLWQALTRDQASLVWRSHPANPITSWYTGLCDGMLRLSDWQIFWRGITPEQVPAAVEEAVSRPNDFSD